MRDKKGRFMKGSQLGKKTQFKKGHKEWKNRDSNNLNLIASQFKKGHKLNVGREVSEETREKIRVKQSGEKGYNWRGGSSFDEYGKEFNNKLKKSIRKKFNYSCFECGLHERDNVYNLTVHHIDYNKKNNKKSNLLLLCNKCHGKTGYNRSNWKKYFEERLT